MGPRMLNFMIAYKQSFTTYHIVNISCTNESCACKYTCNTFSSFSVHGMPQITIRDPHASCVNR